ncbi:AsmA family protein [Pontiellaceae bacterium B1224]|nr:AsmA family protein [Pontiellaceae bacterium B1224]
MKATFKVFGSIVALGLVILAVSHVVMLYGLTKAMRDVVLPRLKEETGIDAQVGRLSINVAAGMLYLDDIEVRNPEGFLLENLASVERIEVELDVKSLFRQKPLIIKNVEVENTLVNVIRNKDGEINLTKLQEQMPLPVEPAESQQVPEPGKQPPEKVPTPGTSVPVEDAKPLPELLFERLLCNATVRYVDFKLNELDIALQLNLKAVNLSTLSDPEAAWGAATVSGALGNDRNSYKTDLSLRLAPIRDTEIWSFDLTGRVMEIDPRSLDSLYKRAGIRTAPFGIEPQFYCRENQFANSQVSIAMQNIQLEEKLSRQLGGMGSIDQLNVTAPVTGTLYEPQVDLQGALMSAIGGNTRSLLDAWIRGQVEKQVGEGDPNASVTDAAVEALAKEVPEIGKSETAKKVLKDLAGGGTSATNAPAPINSDTIVEILGETVDEIGENEELKSELKNLGKWLFGE